jgi:hypothetical protein
VRVCAGASRRVLRVVVVVGPEVEEQEEGDEFLIMDDVEFSFYLQSCMGRKRKRFEDMMDARMMDARMMDVCC